MSERMLMLTITAVEAEHLADLVRQFVDLLDHTTLDGADPALERLAPDAYPDDEEASRDFRRATASELLGRRSTDAARVLQDLSSFDEPPSSPERPVDIALDPSGVAAWMRTLAALRLVIASRLGIETEDDHDDHDDHDDDPRFGVYNWLGYRLEGLVQASDD